jgi:hypothetical protein
VCGSEAYFCLVEPTKEFGMHDYRLDEIEAPARHPKAIQRLRGRTPSLVNQSGGELPGRNLKGRSR